MLGYVTIAKSELKIREYDVYQGYYCSICKAIGKRCGQLPRMTLSYDAVFLAMVLAALEADKDEMVSSVIAQVQAMIDTALGGIENGTY